MGTENDSGVRSLSRVLANRRSPIITPLTQSPGPPSKDPGPGPTDAETTPTDIVQQWVRKTPFAMQREAERLALDTRQRGAKKLEELGFDPIDALVDLYRNGKTTLLTKDGDIVECPLPASDRIKIAATLLDYKYAKNKNIENGSVSDNSVNVVVNWNVKKT